MTAPTPKDIFNEAKNAVVEISLRCPNPECEGQEYKTLKMYPQAYHDDFTKASAYCINMSATRYGKYTVEYCDWCETPFRIPMVIDPHVRPQQTKNIVAWWTDYTCGVEGFNDGVEESSS